MVNHTISMSYTASISLGAHEALDQLYKSVYGENSLHCLVTQSDAGLNILQALNSNYELISAWVTNENRRQHTIEQVSSVTTGNQCGRSPNQVQDSIHRASTRAMVKLPFHGEDHGSPCLMCLHARQDVICWDLHLWSDCVTRQPREFSPIDQFVKPVKCLTSTQRDAGCIGHWDGVGKWQVCQCTNENCQTH